MEELEEVLSDGLKQGHKGSSHQNQFLAASCSQAKELIMDPHGGVKLKWCCVLFFKVIYRVENHTSLSLHREAIENYFFQQHLFYTLD